MAKWLIDMDAFEMVGWIGPGMIQVVGFGDWSMLWDFGTNVGCLIGASRLLS